MSINHEQIQTLKAAADATPATEWEFHERCSLSHAGGGYVSINGVEVIWCLNKAVGGMAHSKDVLRYIAAANPAVIRSLLTDRDADKALIAEQAERIAELECVCAESYQVVGALADSLGVFNDTKTNKALDNLSAQMLVHTDVLPFSVESSTLTVKLQESSIGEDGDFISHAEVVSLRDLRNLCDRAGITLVVGE